MFSEKHTVLILCKMAYQDGYKLNKQNRHAYDNFHHKTVDKDVQKI